MSKFGPGNTFFGLELQNKIVRFEIMTLKFVLLGNYKRKNHGFSNTYCYKSTPSIGLIAKSQEIMKMPKNGTKNALFGYFEIEF